MGNLQKAYVIVSNIGNAPRQAQLAVVAQRCQGSSARIDCSSGPSSAGSVAACRAKRSAAEAASRVEASTAIAPASRMSGSAAVSETSINAITCEAGNRRDQRAIAPSAASTLLSLISTATSEAGKARSSRPHCGRLRVSTSHRPRSPSARRRATAQRLDFSHNRNRHWDIALRTGLKAAVHPRAWPAA